MSSPRQDMMFESQLPAGDLLADMTDEQAARVGVQLLTRLGVLDAEWDTGHTHEVLRAGVERELEALRSSEPLQPEFKYIHQIVAKMVTDCTLRCTYPCYEYVDESWRSLPPVMPESVVAKLGNRIGEYALFNTLDSMSVVLHGGEPLFMRRPDRYYGRVIPLLRESAASVAPSVTLDIGIQTNGMLLREPILETFKQHGVSIGVSVDGSRATHNARRVTKQGKGSYDLMLRGLERLRAPEYAELYSHILCVIDVDSNPLETYQSLLELEPPQLDFLLPYGTWDNPPPAPGPQSWQSAAPYADWLLPIFLQWIDDPEVPDIRLFSSIISLIMHGKSRTEAIGPDAGNEIVVRTDGSFELVDAMKMINRNAVNTNMNIEENSLEQVTKLLRSINMLGKKTLSQTCMDCSLSNICGAGHIMTRYSSERSLDNPSVYCADLMRLISTIAEVVRYKMELGMSKLLSQRGTPPTLPRSLSDQANPTQSVDCPCC